MIAASVVPEDNDAKTLDNADSIWNVATLGDVVLHREMSSGPGDDKSSLTLQSVPEYPLSQKQEQGGLPRMRRP